MSDGRRFSVRRHGRLEHLLAAVPDDVARVFLVGPRPGRTPAGFVTWATGPTGLAGWQAEGHYLEHVDAPVLRFANADRRLEVGRVASWLGEGIYTVDEAKAALHAAVLGLRRRFGAEVMLLTTPATMGRELFCATIAYGVEWPVLTGEHQELIRSTSGQGRIELVRRDGELEGLAELDGRFMYAALCRELPIAPARHDDVATFEPYARARYRVRVTVPAGWDHVGLVGQWTGDTWRWPAVPGEVFETWADGVELFVAQKAGWHFDVLERLMFSTAEGRSGPLDSWAHKLTECWDELRRQGLELAAAAVRNVLLYALGAFVGRTHPVTMSCPAETPDRVPRDAKQLRVEGDRIYWAEHRAPAWPELCHPEWPHTVYARCRARLLSGPKHTGALAVPAGAVVAFRTDALYLDRDPGWIDDGQVGRLRLKSWRQGPLRAPRSHKDLLRLRDGA